MEILDETIGDVAILQLAGRFDMLQVPLLKGRVVDFVNAGLIRMAMGFNDVNFLDSTGLGCLVTCLRTIGPNGRLVLFGMKPNVRKVFSMTKLDQSAFVIVEDREAALEYLASHR